MIELVCCKNYLLQGLSKKHDMTWYGLVQVFEERAYLIGIERKGAGGRSAFGIAESLEELAQLADTAGLTVVGTTYQKYVC